MFMILQMSFGMKFHKKECVDSHCKLCKNSKEKILNIFSKFIDAKGGHGVMKWQVWEQTTIVVNVREKKQKQKKFVKEERRRRMLINKTGSYKDAINHLLRKRRALQRYQVTM